MKKYLNKILLFVFFWVVFIFNVSYCGTMQVNNTPTLDEGEYEIYSGLSDTKVINIGKALVANAITEKGIAADKNDSFATLSKKINKIETGDKLGCYTREIKADITNATVIYSRITVAEVTE